MTDWTPPPTTRWCLVGEPGQRVYRLAESGQPGDPPCPLGPPVKADHADWLAPDGVGTTTTHHGIAGFVEHLILRRASPRPVLKRKAGRPRGRPHEDAPAQPASPGPGAPRAHDRAGGDPRQGALW